MTAAAGFIGIPSQRWWAGLQGRIELVGRAYAYQRKQGRRNHAIPATLVGRIALVGRRQRWWAAGNAGGPPQQGRRYTRPGYAYQLKQGRVWAGIG